MLRRHVAADGGTDAGRACLSRRTPARFRSGGKVPTKEHFGYTAVCGNPDLSGAERDCVPGQAVNWTSSETGNALATGEFLLGYADEAGELPVAPVPHLLGRNGTFLVYRKLHQNVATFRAYLEEKGKQYAGGKENRAAKFVGRWRDGTPPSVLPKSRIPPLSAEIDQNTNFTWRRYAPYTRATRSERTFAARIRATPSDSMAAW